LAGSRSRHKTLNEFVTLSEAKDLLFAAKSMSFASRMDDNI